MKRIWVKIRLSVLFVVAIGCFGTLAMSGGTMAPQQASAFETEQKTEEAAIEGDRGAVLEVLIYNTWIWENNALQFWDADEFGNEASFKYDHGPGVTYGAFTISVRSEGVYDIVLKPNQVYDPSLGHENIVEGTAEDGPEFAHLSLRFETHDGGRLGVLGQDDRESGIVWTTRESNSEVECEA